MYDRVHEYPDGTLAVFHGPRCLARYRTDGWLIEADAWLRTKNESATDSLREAFEEVLTVHRLKVPTLLRKTLLSTNPIESLFSLVRHSERNIKRARGSAMLQQWRGTVLLYCEQQGNRVNGFAGIPQVMATIEAEHVEPPLAQTKKAE